MGGEFENKVSSKDHSGGTIQSPATPEIPVAYSPMAAAIVGQIIRYHKSGNELHFHDDANKFKVALPPTEAWEIARSIQRLIPYRWFDRKQECVLSITPLIESGVLDYAVSVTKVTLGKTAKDINTFLSQIGV